MNWFYTNKTRKIFQIKSFRSILSFGETEIENLRNSRVPDFAGVIIPDALFWMNGYTRNLNTQFVRLKSRFRESSNGKFVEHTCIWLTVSKTCSSFDFFEKEASKKNVVSHFNLLFIGTIIPVHSTALHLAIRYRTLDNYSYLTVSKVKKWFCFVFRMLEGSGNILLKFYYYFDRYSYIKKMSATWLANIDT